MAFDLAALLDAYNSGSLTAMAAFHGLARKGPKTKVQAIADLAGVLHEPDRIQRNWQELSAAERAAVEAILQQGGQATTRSLRDTLARRGLIDLNAKPTYPPRPVNAREQNSRRLEDILARLTLRGLVFAAEDPPVAHASLNATPPKRDLDRLSASVFIPEPVRRHLPEPPPRTVWVTAPPAVATVLASSARTFQRDLYLYWSFVRGEPFTLTAKDEPPKPVLKNINSRLLIRAELGKGQGEQDHPRLRFVRLMLSALNLLGLSPDAQVSVTGQTEFFALPPAERVRRCFETWRAGSFFNELLLLPPSVRPRRGGPALVSANPAAIRARQTVVDRLKDIVAAVAGWISFDTLLGELRSNDYEFLIRRPAPSAANYYRSQPYDVTVNPFGLEFEGVLGDEDGWDKVEANFIRGVLHGPLHWMGLVDLGWTGDARGPAPAFRLAALGQWLLAGGPRPAIPSEGGRVIVQPNLHIVALDPVADATLVQLDRFAERLSAERAVEYRLTRASVYAGQQAGWDGPRIRAFLREQVGAELPANVARTLDEWQAQHERIVLRPNTIFAHGPAAVFDALEASARAAGQSFVAARPVPEVARLDGDAAVSAFIEAVAAQGILPLVTTRPVVAPNSIEASEAGQVRLMAARPNLYLHGHLAPLADPAGADSYQISAASLARAIRAGLTAPEVLRRLEAVNRGPLPEGLARRIRAWAHHYGDAALDEVLLLQVRDPATLEELLADPELAPLLKPFTPSAKKALARVRREDVELLRSRLAERGLKIDSKLD